MVNGQQPPLKPLTVVDLDGTLVDGNTLHEYIKAGFAEASPGNKISLAILAVLRRLRLISHKRMKFSALSLITPTDKLKNRFLSNIKLRPEVKSIIEDKDAVLLATAAPDVYAPWIWHGAYVATPTKNNPNREECRGENKVRAITKGIENQPYYIDTVITDHHDDLPLMKVAREVILVHPSATTIAAAKMAGINPVII
ncbi:MAG: haloacid dehalogenase-like hydrolase [Muribaculaceae bacterium]|nr:haloacid dehalogenase-like hydrolase [Muribaculaceae bacterium]